jgi:CheY-like chemotaxis protein
MPEPTPIHRVLVVDDNVDAADSIANLLTELGQQVRRAYDGRSALIAAAQFRPDLVLIDVVMPRMNGFEVANALREMTGLYAARLVAVTGYGGDHLRDVTASDDFDEHLTKPVSAKDLLDLLATP